MLLDTHIWIWWLIGGDNLSLAEKTALDTAAQQAPPQISAISLWEAQMLHSRGRLALELPFASWLMRATLPEVVQVVLLDAAVILELDRLPPDFHGDPADRIIVATARALDLPLATNDRRIRNRTSSRSGSRIPILSCGSGAHRSINAAPTAAAPAALDSSHPGQ